MKEQYLTPEMEAIMFTAVDVITTSTGTTTANWVPKGNEEEAGIYPDGAWFDK